MLDQGDRAGGGKRGGVGGDVEAGAGTIVKSTSWMISKIIT